MKLEQETYRHSGKYYYYIMYHRHYYYYLLILVVQVGECLWIHSEVVEDHLPLDSPSLGKRIIIMTILLFFVIGFTHLVLGTIQSHLSGRSFILGVVLTGVVGVVRACTGKHKVLKLIPSFFLPPSLYLSRPDPDHLPPPGYDDMFS